MKTYKSQSPQTGQFNSYQNNVKGHIGSLKVSIPSNGSIQFLHEFIEAKTTSEYVSIPSNGSIQFLHLVNLQIEMSTLPESQSPQTGQFNSYIEEGLQLIYQKYQSLNPLKRVNSILTIKEKYNIRQIMLLSQSPQTGQFNSYQIFQLELFESYHVSIPSNGSIQFLLRRLKCCVLKVEIVSIPSNGSIQFLLYPF